MNFKKTFLAAFYSFGWAVPFFCFFAGYFALDLLFASSHVKTPAVVGLSLADALKALAKENLNARLIATKEDPDVTEGTVISQNPTSGSSLRSQQTVFLIISGKPAVRQTARYIGQATSTLLEQLAKEEISYQAFFVPSNHPQGTCIAQLPHENEPADSCPLILYFSQNTSPVKVIVPSFVDKSVPEVTEFLAANGYTYSIFHEHSLPSHHDCSHCLVVEQKPKAGTSISKADAPAIQLKVK